MTKPDTVLRKHLLQILQGGSAYMTFDEAVAGFPARYMNRSPKGVNYTFWHLLEHIRIAQRDILDFIRDPDYRSPDWPDGYWPRKTERSNAQKWKKTIRSITKDRAEFAALIKDKKVDLLAPLPHAKKYTILREVLVAADHAAYHTGEFITLRQVMNIPPPDAW